MRSKEFVKPIVLIIVSLSLVHGGAVKCTGLIGFSSTGAVLVHSSGLVRFRTNHVDSGHGWVSDTGAFTVHCTGIYHLSYTAYGDSKTKITLQKRGTAPAAKFEPVVSTNLGGGSVSILLPLTVGEQIAIVVSGALQTDSTNNIPFTTFNAYKIGD